MCFGHCLQILGEAILDRLERPDRGAHAGTGCGYPAASSLPGHLRNRPVQAGMPVAVTETQGDYFIIDEMLIDKPSTTTMIPVKGDSMD